MKRRGSAKGSASVNVNRLPEEQFDEEQSLDPLSYRLQHLNQRGCNSGDDVDPFDVGSAGSCSDDQLDDINKDTAKGSVDDAGWGANSNYNSGSDYDYDECYQEGDGLFLDFGGRTPQIRRHSSTPGFSGGGSQSTHSHWESTVEHSRRSLSTISCTLNDVSDGLADIERQCVEMISKNNAPASPHELCMPVEQAIAPRSSVGQTSKRAQSISTLSTLSSPTDKCMRINIASADKPQSSLPPPPLSYKPVSRRSSLNAKEETEDITQTDNSTFVEVSIVPQRVEAHKEEECPRLEQLQQMTLDELKSELMKIQAQSKTNLENSWKAAERMRVENSELDEKAERLKTKLDLAFKAGPPLSRRRTDSVKYDHYDLEEEMSDVNPVDGREGKLGQNLSNNKTESRGGVSSCDMKSFAPFSEEEDKYDSIDDVIEAFEVDLESPSGNLPANNNMRQVENSDRSGDSGEFGFFCLDINQSAVKTPLASNTGKSHCLDQSDGNDELSDTKSGVYYPPPNEEEEEGDSVSVSSPRKVSGDNAVAIKVVADKPGFKKRATLGEDQSQNLQSASDNWRDLKRRPSMLVRRKSFRGFFGLNDSTMTAESGMSSDNLDNSNSNQSATLSIEALLDINANIFQVEARSIMIEELENELKEKGEIVANLTGEVEEQNEEINNCELQITRMRKRIDDEYKELTRTQSILQQSVKELIQWDSAIESRLDQTEGRRQRLKQQEKDLKVKLQLKEPNVSDCKVELEHQRSRCKDDYKASQEKSSVSLSMVMNSLRAMNCDNNLEQRSKQLLDSFDTQTDTLHQLFGNSDRVASFTTLKKRIEDQRDIIIKASDKLFRSETDLRGNLIRLKLNREGSNECSHIMESSLASEFTESMLAHIVQAREDHARFLFAAVTKVDDYLMWWDHLLDANSTPKGCEEQGDALHICAILERVLADVTEELAAAQAKIDEEYDLFQSNLLSAGILDQQGFKKLSKNKESNVETNVYQSELDDLNEQVYALETSISEQLAIRKEYASTLDQLYDQDEADSKANLEVLDNIQAQVKLLAKKLATDDDKIASLRRSLREKKERVVNLEYGKKRRDIMQT